MIAPYRQAGRVLTKAPPASWWRLMLAPWIVSELRRRASRLRARRALEIAACSDHEHVAHAAMELYVILATTPTVRRRRPWYARGTRPQLCKFGARGSMSLGGEERENCLTIHGMREGSSGRLVCEGGTLLLAKRGG